MRSCTRCGNNDSSGGKQRQRGWVNAQPEGSHHLPVPCPGPQPTLLLALWIELCPWSFPKLLRSLYLVPDFFFSPAPPSHIWNNWEVTWELYLLRRSITEPGCIVESEIPITMASGKAGGSWMTPRREILDISVLLWWLIQLGLLSCRLKPN